MWFLASLAIPARRPARGHLYNHPFWTRKAGRSRPQSLATHSHSPEIRNAGGSLCSRSSRVGLVTPGVGRGGASFLCRVSACGVRGYQALGMQKASMLFGASHHGSHLWLAWTMKDGGNETGREGGPPTIARNAPRAGLATRWLSVATHTYFRHQQYNVS
ncbi:hypothetical protein B0T24DRAFT_623515 [Lasiosphaeria ovina]|uniref:Uncharacterized protein n=1 Tax=Lasiosphaeria ovina TaxID=92902 RepID=A0AAE0KC86_9PEZI|nr:hypothetical protein B0T24DRAFT_623515 [Lasiosphaeria ovina]